MTEEKAPKSEVVEELQTLGEQLVTAVKALWESEDARHLRQEIGDGFAELSQQVDDAVKKAKDSEAAKEFETKVKDTVDKAREADITGQVQEGLVTGLQQLNAELSKWIGSLGRPEAPATDVAAEAEPEGEA